jgi:vesicular inhibitory amino acid transporter
VVTMFGNLSLAYGAAIVIPALQRQHSDPTRMPRVVCVTLGFISCLFLILASLGYSAVGCQISGNLLFTIYPDSTTGLTTLGFAPHWGTVVMAFLFMQLHITIAFAVIVSPAFYILERLVLGMHKKMDLDVADVEALKYESVETPGDAAGAEVEQKIPFPRNSVVSVADIEKASLEYDEELKEYKGSNALKYVILRLVVLVLLVLLSIALKNHFGDLTDFTGASCITVNSILLPIIFYLKKFWGSVPIWEKIPALTVVVVCFALGCYVTYTSGKALFKPSSSTSTAEFPFCHPEYQNLVYYNQTA